MINRIYIIYYLFQIYESNKYPTSNIDIGNISFFPSEKEVLFLPFSSFEIEKIENTTINAIDFKIVNLRYWDKYSNKIEEFLSSKTEEEKTQFFADSVNYIIAKDFIFNIDKHFTMSQNYARYCGIEKKVFISSNEKKNYCPILSN